MSEDLVLPKRGFNGRPVVVPLLILDPSAVAIVFSCLQSRGDLRRGTGKADPPA
jgi:hypothetical protein